MATFPNERGNKGIRLQHIMEKKNDQSFEQD